MGSIYYNHTDCELFNIRLKSGGSSRPLGMFGSHSDPEISKSIHYHFVADEQKPNSEALKRK